MKPLAERLRPAEFDQIVGQEKVLDFLREIAEADVIPSMIFWGPPGSGKTTIACVFAKHAGREFVTFSGVDASIAGVREYLRKLGQTKLFREKPPIIFIDEIHRLNRTQQDAFLASVEQGEIVLIGATTENPFFEVTKPLLSRMKVIQIRQLTPEEILTILFRARDSEFKEVKFEEGTLEAIAHTAGGDSRFALNTLELSVQKAMKQKAKTVTIKLLDETLMSRHISYDRNREEHYNIISAFIKSLRGSDVDAALYWLARMVEGGEDPLFIARRMIIFASEDVGNADPNALLVSVAVKDAVDFLGMPEGFLPLSQGVIYLALSPKSNSALLSYMKARDAAHKYSSAPVPLHIRNAPVKGMAELGYGKGYEYTHDFQEKLSPQHFLPKELQDATFYTGVPKGFEKTLMKRYQQIRQYFAKHRK